VHALRGFKGLFWRHQPHSQVDASYYEHAFLCFHLARHFSHELPVARIDVTRIQRASEGFCWIDFVVPAMAPWTLKTTGCDSPVK
jgi:hypothetical protein